MVLAGALLCAVSVLCPPKHKAPQKGTGEKAAVPLRVMFSTGAPKSDLAQSGLVVTAGDFRVDTRLGGASSGLATTFAVDAAVKRRSRRGGRRHRRGVKFVVSGVCDEADPQAIALEKIDQIKDLIAGCVVENPTPGRLQELALVHPSIQILVQKFIDGESVGFYEVEKCLEKQKVCIAGLRAAAGDEADGIGLEARDSIRPWESYKIVVGFVKQATSLIALRTADPFGEGDKLLALARALLGEYEAMIAAKSPQLHSVIEWVKDQMKAGVEDISSDDIQRFQAGMAKK